MTEMRGSGSSATAFRLTQDGKAADTTNGCINTSFTPPSGSDVWDVFAHVEFSTVK